VAISVQGKKEFDDMNKRMQNIGGEKPSSRNNFRVQHIEYRKAVNNLCFDLVSDSIRKSMWHNMST